MGSLGFGRDLSEFMCAISAGNTPSIEVVLELLVRSLVAYVSDRVRLAI